MSRPLPPLNWFRAFECAARRLSFTSAAEELNLTQSAVSQNVRSLETRLGSVLFVRKARGLALTDSGRQLLPYVTGAISELAKGTEIFDPLKADDVLTVACSASFALLWLAPRLGAFRDREPGLDIRIASTLWPDDFLQSQSDVQIRFGSRDLVGEDARLLMQDTLVPLCAPCLAQRLTAWCDIADTPLIQAVGTSDNWRTWSEQLGLPPPPAVTLSVDSHALAFALARSGVGLALGSRILGAGMIRDGDLSVPFDHAAPALDNYYIALRDGYPKGHAAASFRDWIFAEVGAQG